MNKNDTGFNGGSISVNGNSFADIICFSHLRWNFVYQRPQHLLSRASVNHRVFFIEEPLPGDNGHSYYTESFYNNNNTVVITPAVPRSYVSDTKDYLKNIVNDVVKKYNIKNYITWFYTPMSFDLAQELTPKAVVYDCMDELSLFAGAPPELKQKEKELLSKADVVFTGGCTLYEYKKNSHSNIYCFPSSIDKKHFASAKDIKEDPADQAGIPHPRIGYFGVIDERMDIKLLDEVSSAKPDWHFVMLGPVVKIDPALLPAKSNIHYLGQKTYNELPSYIAGWDIAFLPFAKNDSTRFISPTKTPEYLAAGKPVISSSINDVVNPYGKNGYVKIADTPEEFINAALEYLTCGVDDQIKHNIEVFLESGSWDNTWEAMFNIIKRQINGGKTVTGKKVKAGTV